MKYKDMTFSYSTLTRIQRKAIDAFIAIDPSLATASNISRGLLEETFKKARALDPKLGYPAFVTRCERVARGVYPWPSPGAVVNLSAIKSPEVAKTVEQTEFEETFAKEMADYGII
jgi:hypothetical protein